MFLFIYCWLLFYFPRNHRDDYLDLLRDFEVKKIGIAADMNQKVTFKVPISLHETFSRVRGEDFRYVIST